MVYKAQSNNIKWGGGASIFKRRIMMKKGLFFAIALVAGSFAGSNVVIAAEQNQEQSAVLTLSEKALNRSLLEQELSTVLLAAKAENWSQEEIVKQCFAVAQEHGAEVLHLKSYLIGAVIGGFLMSAIALAILANFMQNFTVWR